MLKYGVMVGEFCNNRQTTRVLAAPGMVLKGDHLCRPASNREAAPPEEEFLHELREM